MKTYDRSIFYLPVLLLAALIVACKKEHTDQTPDAIAPTFPHGTIDGEAFTQTIGPAGGTLHMPDGRLQITIPEGALSSETPFVIQPVKQTLELGSGKVYRLSPENISFRKDVVIQFSYTDADTEGTLEDFLYLAYQDAEGHWYRASKTALDKTHKTLSLHTRHFSDWTVHRDFMLSRIDNKDLSENEEAKFRLMMADIVDTTAEDHSDLLGPIDVDIDPSKLEGWSVRGAGTIQGDTKGATYKAPATIATPSTSLVNVTLTHVVDKYDPSRPGNSGKVIVQGRVNLVPGQFFKWTIDGQEFTSITDAMAVAAGGMLTIIANDANGATIELSINAGKGGTYPSGDTGKPDHFGAVLVYQTEPYQHFYLDDEGKIKYGSGSLTLTSIDTHYVSGNFSVTCYTGQHKSKKATGSFKVRIF